MVRSIIGLCFGIILVALGLSLLFPGLISTFSGITIRVLGSIGAFLLVGFILFVVFSWVGILLAGIIGLVGVILLSVALPFLAPVFIVIIPIVILMKLVKG